MSPDEFDEYGSSRVRMDDGRRHQALESTNLDARGSPW